MPLLGVQETFERALLAPSRFSEPPSSADIAERQSNRPEPRRERGHPATRCEGLRARGSPGPTFERLTLVGAEHQLLLLACPAPPWLLPPIVADDEENACGLDTSVVTDTSVYVPGEMTITYASGTIPMAIEVAAGNITGWSAQRLDEAIQNGDGSWICSGPVSENDTVLTYNWSPGQSVTRPIWVLLSGVLTNDAPNFTPSGHTDIAFDGATIGTPGPGIGATIHSATGPHAMTCDENGSVDTKYNPEISLFGTPPFSMPDGSGGTAQCGAPSQ